MQALEALKHLYASEITSHSDWWNYPHSFDSWEADLQHSLTYFLDNRPCMIEGHIVEFFQLSGFGFNCADTWDIASESEIVVGPNPSTGHVFYLNNTVEKFVGKIQIASSAGRIVRQYDAVVIEPNEKRYDNLSDLGAGMYFIKFIGSEFTTSNKILVQY